MLFLAHYFSNLTSLQGRDILTPFYRWGNQDPGRLSQLLKVTELINAGNRVSSQVCLMSEPCFLLLYCLGSVKTLSMNTRGRWLLQLCRTVGPGQNWPIQLVYSQFALEVAFRCWFELGGKIDQALQKYPKGKLQLATWLTTMLMFFLARRRRDTDLTEHGRNRLGF